MKRIMFDDVYCLVSLTLWYELSETNSNIGEACEHSGVPLSIDCGDGFITVIDAAYGVYSNDNTCGVSYGGDCLSTTSLEVL